MINRRAHLTIDVDFTDYISGSGVNEMEDFFPLLRNYFEQHESVKTTWFVRIDNQIAREFRSADYILTKYSGEFNWLRANGHEIGWHHHAYTFRNGLWQQESDDDIVLSQVKEYGLVARKHGMKLCRMGWGQMSEAVMVELDNLGFEIDSSAMPRPRYAWDQLKRDWSKCPADPYHPSRSDYQLRGDLRILEVPMTTVPVQLKTDTEDGVLRYINPLYYHSRFVSAVRACSSSLPVFIFHPYELRKDAQPHLLLSFSYSEFVKNLDWLINEGYQFNTLSQSFI
jgi:hypothetical protein